MLWTLGGLAREHFRCESVGMLGVLAEGCELGGDRVLPVRLGLRGKAKSERRASDFSVRFERLWEFLLSGDWSVRRRSSFGE